MPEAPPARIKPEETKPENGTKSSIQYQYKFDPGEDFSETALFVKGVVRGTIWISGNTPVLYRSLTGEEVDRINAAVKVTPDMSVTTFNTEVTYWNLAHSIEKIGETRIEGAVEEKIKRFRSMAAPILTRLQLGYLEFNLHIEELFKGKEVGELAKKS
jgi:hypothetical protein